MLSIRLPFIVAIVIILAAAIGVLAYAFTRDYSPGEGVGDIGTAALEGADSGADETAAPEKPSVGDGGRGEIPDGEIEAGEVADGEDASDVSEPEPPGEAADPTVGLTLDNALYPGTQSARGILLKLRNTEVEQFMHEEATLETLLELLSAECGVPIELDSGVAEEELMISLNLSKAEVGQILNLICRLNELAYYFRADSIFVTRAEVEGFDEEMDDEEDEVKAYTASCGTHKILVSTRIPAFSVADRPLEAILAYISRMTQIGFIVDEEILKSHENLSFDFEEMSAYGALCAMMDAATLEYRLQNGVVVIKEGYRREEIEAEEAAKTRALEEKLKNTKVERFVYFAAPLGEIMLALMTHGFGIIIDRSVKDDVFVTVDKSNASLKEILDAVVESTGLEYYIVEGLVFLQNSGTRERQLAWAEEKEKKAIEANKLSLSWTIVAYCCFMEEPIANVAHYLANLWRERVDLALDPDTAAGIRVTLSLYNQTMKTILDTICSGYGLNYRVTADGVVVGGKE